MIETLINEQNAAHYNQHWKTNYSRYTKEHQYVSLILKIMTYTKIKFNHVLDIGAGFGFPALKLISSLPLKNYTAYEFSNAADFMKQLLLPFTNSCEITIIKDTFKGINTSKYDCVIALEIFEHINWDLEFIELLNPGTNLFISLPINQKSIRHTKIFCNQTDIQDRYSSIIDFRFIGQIEKWSCIYGIKK